MKFVAELPALVRAAKTVCPIALDKAAVPILGSVLIRAANGVSLTATDTDICADASFAADVSERGAACVSASAFWSFVSSLPEGAQIECSVKMDHLAMRCGRSRCALATLPAEDFPKFSTDDRFHQATIKTSDLASLIERVAFAQTKDQAWPVRCGINLAPADGSLRAVTTNGNVVAVATASVAGDLSGMAPVTVPSRTIAVMSKLCAGASGDVSLEIGERLLRATVGDISIITKLLDGAFPDHNRVVPELRADPVVIIRADLLSAIRRVSTIVDQNKDGRGIKLKASGGAIEITGASTLGEIDDAVDTRGTTEAAISCNAIYLRDALGASKAEAVEMHIGDPGSPMLIRPHGESADLVVMTTYRG